MDRLARDVGPFARDRSGSPDFDPIGTMLSTPMRNMHISASAIKATPATGTKTIARTSSSAAPAPPSPATPLHGGPAHASPVTRSRRTTASEKKAAG